MLYILLFKINFKNFNLKVFGSYRFRNRTDCGLYKRKNIEISY